MPLSLGTTIHQWIHLGVHKRVPPIRSPGVSSSRFKEVTLLPPCPSCGPSSGSVAPRLPWALKSTFWPVACPTGSRRGVGLGEGACPPKNMIKLLHLMGPERVWVKAASPGPTEGISGMTRMTSLSSGSSQTHLRFP